MTVTQVSRIQHRRGLSTELPLALNEGELGLTTDTGQIFIGAPDFAPIVNRTSFPFQNIELLTEFSIADLLETSATYAYRYQDPDNVAFPGAGSFRATPAFVVERLLQERLDERVSVKAYGAKGNGITDDTLAIFNACKDIFSIESQQEGPARTLFFPAGTYRISSTIPLYPFTRWMGEGIGKTIIILTSNTIDQGILTVNIDPLPATPAIGDLYNVNGTGILTDGSFSINVVNGDQIVATGIDELVGDPWVINDEAFKAVVETVDGQGNTGLNITDLPSGGGGPDPRMIPQQIDVVGIDFQLDESTGSGISGKDIVQLNRSNNVSFRYCRFAGQFECIDLENQIEFGGYFDEPNAIGSNFMQHGKYDATRDGICVRIDSLSLLNSNIFSRDNYQFIGCEFANQPYAFYITDSVINVNVTDAKFNEHYRSIVLGEGNLPGFVEELGDLSIVDEVDFLADPTIKFGPQNFRVSNSLHENIAGPAFSVYSTNTGNISAFNAYRRYGRGCIVTGDLITEPFIAPGVFFYADPANDSFTNDNASINDDFDYVPDSDRVTALAVFADQDNRRVFSLSNNNTISIPSIIDHHSNGIQLGEITRGAMQPETIQLENNQVPFPAPKILDQPTGIILELDGEQRADAIIIDYSLTRGFSSRKGQIHIIADSSGSDLEWYENIVDVGIADIEIEFDVTLAVLPDPTFADPIFVRVKYTDNADPADYGTLGFHKDTDKMFLKWSATYWDGSISDYGIVVPGDLEPPGVIDVAGIAGILDYGLVTDVVVTIEDFESTDGLPGTLNPLTGNMTLPLEPPTGDPIVYGTL